jgi:acetylornithine deacetylase/succinyl-diaminopimelate desuccinylase-like protein
LPSAAEPGPGGPADAELVDRALDRPFLVRALTELARVPTNVDLGFDTLIEPDHPRLVHYVQDVVRPRLVDLGVHDLLDAPRNNLVARLGTGETGRRLLIQSYTPSQHHNLMERPFDGVVANGRRWGRDEPVVVGQGVSQNKAHQAVMLSVLKLLRDLGVQLRGRLYWALNNEGRSTHDCTDAILDSLDAQPTFAIVQTPQNLAISLGNRGRFDIDVVVRGRQTHSSTPDEGLSAIDGAMEVVARLRSLRWDAADPRLGAPQAVVYKVDFEPKAPHTLPGVARLTIDRRTLPDERPEDMLAEVRDAIGDLAPYTVEVHAGVRMLPALVDADHPGVRALQHAVESARGMPAPEIHKRGCFDAGGMCARGIPAVMFGCGGQGDWPTGTDFVAIADVEDEARILARLILDTLT